MPTTKPALYQNNLFVSKYLIGNNSWSFIFSVRWLTSNSKNVLLILKLMLSREELTKEYIKIINGYYPAVSGLMRHCLLKILQLNGTRIQSQKRLYYLVIYYPEKIGGRLLQQQDVFRDAAENIGLVEVVFVSANRLIKDPLSKIKQQDFRFWLELCWLANE